MTDIAALRENYTKGSLDVSDVSLSPIEQFQKWFVSDVSLSPIEQFQKWFNEAIASQLLEPNAFLLSTISPERKPSSRILLLKGIDKGFKFYTNYLSRKGTELAENPHACITFFWAELERQVRIEGLIEKVSAEDSDEYFQSRPRGSQVGAWVSNQSMVIENREVLEAREKHLIEKFGDGIIPRPPHWGGYRLVPNYI
ncbi:MAG: pyridoxamine 5'-phosphate oxidase, partial [Arcicella sp.]|nr:pyridoxamine 5'-phosphate oxidase [Arcicella sp.]